MPSYTLAGSREAALIDVPLDLLPSFEPPDRSGRRWLMGGIAGFFLLCIFAIVTGGYFALRDPAGVHAPASANSPLNHARFDLLPGKDAAEIAASTNVGQESLEKISAEDAMKINARMPVAMDVGPAAKPFVVPLADGGGGYMRALDCMTSAIYYEAVNEPLDGQRAVAQVVINRVHHFSYPKSVCGVVYQGASRKTGCQFSFTCDGSLARRPSAAGWARSRAVARAALSGFVDGAVGLATHYHADYVFPYWAPTLVRQTVIGRHIFYRWPGTWGTTPSFAGAYQRAEPDVWHDEKYLAGKAQPVLDETQLVEDGEVIAKPMARPVLSLVANAESAAGAATADAKVPGDKDRAYLMDRKASEAKAVTDKAPPPRPSGVTGAVIMPGGMAPAPVVKLPETTPAK